MEIRDEVAGLIDEEAGSQARRRAHLHDRLAEPRHQLADRQVRRQSGGGGVESVFRRHRFGGAPSTAGVLSAVGAVCGGRRGGWGRLAPHLGHFSFGHQDHGVAQVHDIVFRLLEPGCAR